MGKVSGSSTAAAAAAQPAAAATQPTQTYTLSGDTSGGGGWTGSQPNQPAATGDGGATTALQAQYLPNGQLFAPGAGTAGEVIAGSGYSPPPPNTGQIVDSSSAAYAWLSPAQFQAVGIANAFYQPSPGVFDSAVGANLAPGTALFQTVPLSTTPPSTTD
ncbi:MAG: hypothetical protein WA634_02480 [Silvibacterium sp.]